MRKLCLILLALGVSSGIAHGADQVTLNSTDINCTISGEKPGVLLLEEWMWGNADKVGSVAGSFQPGALSLNSVQVRKASDLCSSKLMGMYFVKHKFGNIVISQTKSGGGSATGETYATVTLSNAYLSSFSFTTASTNSAPDEIWTLSFSKICVETWPQKQDGTLGQGKQMCYGK